MNEYFMYINKQKWTFTIGNIKDDDSNIAKTAHVTDRIGQLIDRYVVLMDILVYMLEFSQ